MACFLPQRHEYDCPTPEKRFPLHPPRMEYMTAWFSWLKLLIGLLGVRMKESDMSRSLHSCLLSFYDLPIRAITRTYANHRATLHGGRPKSFARMSPRCCLRCHPAIVDDRSCFEMDAWEGPAGAKQVETSQATSR